MRLQLVVEKDELIVADLANSTDNSPTLAIFDHSCKRRAFLERRAPSAVFYIQRFPHHLAVFDEAHNDGRAISAESQYIRHINRGASRSHQRQMIILAGFDFPKLRIVVVHELR